MAVIRRSKILVVDDERNVREVLDTFLSDRGYEVLTARNAREAIQHIEKRKPDLLLLDIRLPDVSGEDVLDYLRDRERIRRVDRLPVIVISGVLTEHLAPRLIKHGADGLIVKPFELSRVLKEIERVLDRARRRTQPGGKKTKALKNLLQDPTIEDIRPLASRLKALRRQIDRLDRELGEEPEDKELVSVDDYVRKIHQLHRELERKRLQKEGQDVITALRKIEQGIQDRIKGLSEDEKKSE